MSSASTPRCSANTDAAGHGPRARPAREGDRRSTARNAFVGSPNVDPRSLEINTEIGVATESADLARKVAALIVRDMAPANAWRVTMDAKGTLTWTSSAGVVQRQPATGFSQRAVEFLLNLLPLKDQS